MTAQTTRLRRLTPLVAAIALPAILALSCSRSADRDESASYATGDQTGVVGRAADGADAVVGPQADPAPPIAAPAPADARQFAKESAQSLALGAAQGGAARATAVQATAADPMLIRTGNTAIEVDSLDAAIERVRRLAASLGGFVAGTSSQTGTGEIRSATLELRLPAARFDDALAGLSPLGEVESVNVHTLDVGEEYVDVTARIATGRQLEERLVRLLQTRTGKLEDVLAVERELARVRGEIERLEGRLRWLRARVDMSTLQVHLHEPMPVIPPRVGHGPIGEAFRQAWRNLVAVTAAGIASLGFVGPLAALGALIFVALRRWRRRVPVATMEA